ncbi:MAG: tyrosine-type recombinase/integrase [Gemmatimonadales bacterium]|nr:tyrosine-type recombinase/integrase [Gemmatimonadales bacterium]
MVYKDKTRNRFRLKFKLHDKWVVLASGTEERDLADAYDATIAQCLRHGLTELVELVRSGGLPLSLLHQELTAGGVNEVRNRIRDRLEQRDLRPLVAAWVEAMTRRGKPSPLVRRQYAVTVNRVLGGTTRPVYPRDLTAPTVNRRILAGPNARKSYAAFRLWWRFLYREGVVPNADLLLLLEAPPVPKARDRFLSEPRIKELLAVVKPKYRDAISLCYSAGLEVSTLLRVRMEDIDVQNRLLIARGTKTDYRTRWVRVADWGWEAVERMMATAPKRGGFLAPRVQRFAIGDAHRRAAEQIGEKGLRLHDARRAFTVRLLRAGVPVMAVASALAHGSGAMVQSVYGRWKPNAEEMNRWEAQASGQDK